MAQATQLMLSIDRGEVTPLVHARIDAEDYTRGLKTCENFLLQKYGGGTRTPGTLDIGACAAASNSRLIPFIFSETQAYVLEFSNLKLRLVTISDGILLSGASPYEVVTPYLTADLWKIDTVSIGDEIYINCDGYEPRVLTRSADTTWTLETLDVEDGPWLPVPPGDDTVDTNGTGHAIPQMTGLAAPSGTVTSSGSYTDAWKLFDRTVHTKVACTDNTAGWIEYDYGAGNTRWVTDYILKAPDVAAEKGHMPTSWVIEGQQDGTATWVVIDTQTNVEPWLRGETRYFETKNLRYFRKLRFTWRDGGGTDSGNTILGSWEPLLHPDTQTPFALTISAIDNVNNGVGFVASDVGRLMRVLCDDGIWRTLKIDSVNSAPNIEVVVVRPGPIPSGDRLNGVWQLQAWSTETGWPKQNFLFSGRLSHLGTDEEPRTGWLSKVDKRTDYGVSQPLRDDDTVTFTMRNGNVDNALWGTAIGTTLFIGTLGGVRVIGKRDTSAVFGPSNIEELDQINVRPGAVPPIWIDRTLIYADKQRSTLFEAAYSNEAGGFDASELTLLAEHIFGAKVKELHYQRKPLSVLYAVLDNGEIAAATFNKRQGTFGVGRVIVPGTAASVISMAILPGTDYDVPFLAVKRTVDGTVQYRIERMLDPYRVNGNSSYDIPCYLMSAIRFTAGVATTTITGLGHLVGETVGVYDAANGADIGSLVVSAAGEVTLGAGATPVTDALVGLRYTSQIETLRPPNVPQDGKYLAAPMVVQAVDIDVFETYGLRAGGSAHTALLTTEADHANSPWPPTLHTGMLSVPAEEGWAEDQSVVIETDSAYPASIRAIAVTLERGE